MYQFEPSLVKVHARLAPEKPWGAAMPSIVWADVVATLTAVALFVVCLTVIDLPELPTAVGRVTVKAPPLVSHGTSSPMAAE
jgi:hypothetical protein